MSRALLILNNDITRQRAINWVQKAPAGTRVEFKEAKRSTEQNDKMHAMLTEVASQCLWHGLKLNVPDWKLVFLDGLKKESRVVPNWEGNGLLSLGRHTSDLGVKEMTDMIELIYAYGAEHGVTFNDQRSAA